MYGRVLPEVDLAAAELFAGVVRTAGENRGSGPGEGFVKVGPHARL